MDPRSTAPVETVGIDGSAKQTAPQKRLLESYPAMATLKVDS